MNLSQTWMMVAFHCPMAAAVAVRGPMPGAIPMAKKLDGHPDPGASNGQHAGAPADEPEQVENGNDELLATAATVGVVAVGALVFEAALIPGIALGVCAMLAPKALPKIGGGGKHPFQSAGRAPPIAAEKALH